MKVYGITLGRNRSIVAARSTVAAAKAFDISTYLAKTYACETGNEEEIELAMKEPGQVFAQSLREGHSAQWIKVERHYS